MISPAGSSNFILFLCAILIGVDKGGIPGLGALAVAIAANSYKGTFAHSMAMMVPILAFADVGALFAFFKDARYDIIYSLLTPMIVGVLVGVQLMNLLSDSSTRKFVGASLFLMAFIRYYSALMNRKSSTTSNGLLPISTSESTSTSNELNAWKIFAGMNIIGFICGIFTVLANVAGPVLTVWLLVLGLLKRELNGTRACVFALMNCIKIPAQIYLGNIFFSDIWQLVPLIVAAVLSTILTERYLLGLIRQQHFEEFSWILVTVGAVKLVLEW